ncbi:hypothetical protein E3U35_03145 [Histophilus somni]|uniref:Uncharacterized protein n=1 Tax=Histophilus somni TaxID=731 RepID=A0AAX2RY89_HISSO|nr:hypothetical protein E1290_07795 [Histophilus somni]TEW29085.1 hypothetical protein E2R48_07620 [Histophilus somni]TFF02232.1 hypothetical protein E3U35_03145 [Histophilus somni]THA43872.1 hypothetical protein E5429_08520 [Histophilus somni]THA91194.1 hypothetical protein E6A58_07960 [Histophilus somni]
MFNSNTCFCICF